MPEEPSARSSLPSVSVVVTMYNQAAYIDGALRSVLAQTLRPLEIIVVDDGSSDDTRTVLAPYRACIRYVHQSNQGVAAARNTGVRLARGDLVALLDGDDAWEPEKLAVQARAAATYPDAGLIVVDGEHFGDPEVDGVLLLGPSTWARVGGPGPVNVRRGYDELLRENFISTTSQVMIPRRVLEAIGPSDSSLPLGGDYDLYLRVAARHELVLIDRRLTRWRCVPTSVSGPRARRPFRWAEANHATWRKHVALVLPERRAALRRQLRASLRSTARAVAVHGRQVDRAWATGYLVRLWFRNVPAPAAATSLVAVWAPRGVLRLLTTVARAARGSRATKSIWWVVSRYVLPPIRDLMARVRRAVWTLAASAWWAASAMVAAGAAIVPRRAAGGPCTLLLITSAFPPLVTGGTFRPLALVRHATDRGWRVLVASREPDWTPGALARQLWEIVPPEVRVARVRSSAWPPLPAWFPRIDGGFMDALATTLHTWLVFRRERPHVILASGPPFHVFVAGRYLARLFGSPLVLDYRDEWSQCPFGFVSSGPADAAWEQRCLRSAAAVVFTTRSQKEHHRRVFPTTPADRCHVIPNGWSAASPPATVVTPTSRGARLSFIGTLGDHTLPDDFLDTLGRAVEARPRLRAMLRVRFVGYRSERAAAALAAFALADMLELMDEVPKPEADRFMRESTALLLLNDPRFERYLPGKLYEYLAAGRPVLIFGEGGESGRLIEDLDGGIVVPAGDASALAEAVERIGSWSGDGQCSQRRAAWLREHSRERLSQRMLDLLESVARSTPPLATRAASGRARSSLP